jgi:HIRAN domain-containing protein
VTELAVQTLHPGYASTMELGIAIGIAVLVVVWIFSFLLRDPETIQRPMHDDSPERSTVTFKTYDPDEYKAQNGAREEWLKQHYPDSDKWIFTKVVGVSHKNSDGSYRKKVIRRCRVQEELQLVPEPDNPFDSTAVAVCRANGEQLGYLNQRLAADMHRWMENGQHLGRCPDADHWK